MPSGEITARELWDRLQGRAARRFYLLDVRGEDDRALPAGPAAVLVVRVPWFAFVDDPAAALARVPRDAGEAVAIGANEDSSRHVRDLLREAGLAAVRLTGGMQAWGDLHVPLRVRPAPGDRAEVWQVSRCGKGCLSYVVVACGEAAVVDPSRFVEVYERLARSRGARVVEVIDTHVHADHLSGGPALARRTGAHYRIALEGAPLDAAPLVDGDAVELGGGATALRPLRTPGHTPESTCLLLDDRILFSGDTLLASGAGRPDLGARVDEWGRALHRSLRELAERLPHHTLLLPAHFASPLEASWDGVVCARLDELRTRSPELSIDDPAELVALLRASAVEPPVAHASIARANRGLVDPGDLASEWELGGSAYQARPPAGDRWGGSAAHPA